MFRRCTMVLGVLCAAIFAGAISPALDAQASLINVVVKSTDTQLPQYQTNGQVYSNVLSCTRTPNALATSLDEIDICFNNIEAFGGPSPAGLPLLEGIWTVTSGAEVIQTSIFGATPWCRYSDNTYTPILISWYSMPGSYVNLPYNSAAAVPWSQTAGGLAGNYTSVYGTGQSDTEVYGSWYTGGIPLTDGSLLAKFFVDPGGNVSFHSTLNSSKLAIGGWDISGVQYQGDFTTAPEPSALVLLGIGAISLLAHVWRRRKQTA